MTTEQLRTIEEVSAYLQVPVKTLYDWRGKGYGPEGKRIGKYVRYKAELVIAWFDALDDESS
ncbi:helix-turn-helix domain-containing protein [Saccharomonospora sp. NPDC046836]|uniref:helix-turn-helix transcriptional regulator n=1 Tax=Saccharomonospora sp. NPDC046836 TaxID=3156921 RepID=UPI0033FD1AAD